MATVPDKDFNKFLKEFEVQDEFSVSPSETLQTAIEITKDISPDEEAKVFSLSSKTGLPADVVRSDINRASSIADSSEFDIDAFSAESPVTTRWAGNLSNAAIIKDDLKQTGLMESALNKAIGIPRAFAETPFRFGATIVGGTSDIIESSRTAGLEFGDMLRNPYNYFGNTNKKGLPRLNRINPETGKLEFDPYYLNEQNASKSARMRERADIESEQHTSRKVLNAITDHVIEGFQFNEEGLDTAADFFAPTEEQRSVVSDVVGGITQLGTQVLALARNPALATSMFTAQGADQGAASVEQFEKENGVKLDDHQKALAIGLYGLVTGQMERLSTMLVAGKAGEAVDFLEGKMSKALGRLAGATLAGMGEATQELAEGMLQNLIDQQVYNPDQKVFTSDSNYEAGIAGTSAFIFRAVLDGITGSKRIRGVAQDIDDGLSHEERMKVVGEEAAKTKLVNRSREKLQELAAAITAGAEDQNIYLDVEGANEYLQSNDIDPYQFYEAMGLDPSAISESDNIYSDMAIPLSTFVAQLSGTEHYDGLIAHTKMKPEGLTPAKARVEEENYAETVNSIIDEIDKKSEQEQALYVGELSAYDSFYAQILNTRKFTPTAARDQALYWTSFYKQMAKGLNASDGTSLTAEDAYKKFPVNISAPLPGALTRKAIPIDEMDLALNALRESRGPTNKDIYGAGLIERLQSLGGIQDEGGELSKRDLHLYHKDKKGSKKLVTEDGMTFERLAEFLHEEGYFDETPTQAEMLDLIRSSALGEVDPVQTKNMDTNALEKRRYLEDLDQLLDENGLDVFNYTNDEIKAFIEQGTVPEGRAAFDPDYSESGNLLSQSEVDAATDLPDRFDIIRYLQGFDGLKPSELIDVVASNVDKHNSLSLIVGGESSLLPAEALSGLPTDAVVYSGSEGSRGSFVWDYDGKVYRVIGDKVTELGDDQAVSTSANILSRVFRDIRESDPVYAEAQRSDKIKRDEILRRQKKFADIPNLSPDFDSAVKELADWADNKREFIAALSPSLFDISDRNRTRLGRAAMVLDPDGYNNAGKGDVTIYRAMPKGQKIEAGDWVSFDREYASGHESNVRKGGAVTEELTVPGTDVWWYGADDSEWVYIPEGTWGDITSVDELWDSVNADNKPDDYPLIEGQQLYQQGYDPDTLQEQYEDGDLPPDLVVTHNLSEANLKAAFELGGLAAPSLAVQRASKGFEGFGEISLLGPKEMINDKSIPFFDADIYSPRQPRAVFDIDIKAFNKLIDDINQDSEMMDFDKPYMDSLSRSEGLKHLLRNEALQYHWLKQQGIAPKLAKKPLGKHDKKAVKIANDLNAKSAFALVDNPDFIKVAEQRGKEIDDKLIADGLDAVYFRDGVFEKKLIMDYAYKIASYVNSSGVDTYSAKDAIRKKIRIKKNSDAYEKYANSLFDRLVTRKKLFTGTSPTGAQKFTDYNLSNVVRQMTKELQSGEGFNYSNAGQARSAIANKLNSVNAVKKARSKIVSKEEMDAIKEESYKKYRELLEDLKPYYKWDSNSFLYDSSASEAIIKYGLGRESLSEDFDTDTDYVKGMVDEFFYYLGGLPTEYFEGKARRAVDLSEFDTAIVPKNASNETKKILKDAGIKVRLYDSKVKGDRSRVVKNQGKLLFQQKRANRASIQLPDTFGEGESLIKLFEGSNKSSLMHELGHQYLEILKYLNSQENVDPVIADSMAKIKSWLSENSQDIYSQIEQYGIPKKPKETAADYAKRKSDVMAEIDKRGGEAYVKSLAEGGEIGLSGDPAASAIGVTFHEYFARGHEAFLLEGKTSNKEMEGVFRKFSEWMKDIYKKIKALNVKLNDDIREVFDRMVASTEEIEAAEKERGMDQDLNRDIEIEGMTDEEVAEMNKLREEATAEEEDMFRQWLMRDITQKEKKAWKAERIRVEDQVTEEVDAIPVYKALKELQSPTGIKLSKSDIVDAYGAEMLSLLPKPYVYRAKGGVHPDLAAEMFGFNSGEEMLKTIAGATPRKAYIQATVDDVMAERYNAFDGGRINELADQAINDSEKRADVLLGEMKYLARAAGKSFNIDRKQIDHRVKVAVGKKTISEIGGPMRYKAGEVRAAKEVEKAIRERDWEAAYEAKHRQIVNYYMFRYVAAARQDIEKIRKRLGKRKNGNMDAKIYDTEYIYKVRELLEMFDFRASKLSDVRAKKLEAEAIVNWIKRQNDEPDVAIQYSKVLLDAQTLKHTSDMTYDELKELDETVKSLLKNSKVLGDEAKAAREAENKKTAEAIKNNRGKKKKHSSARDPSLIQKGKSLVDQFTAFHRKYESLVRQMDNWENMGYLWDRLFKPLNDAANNSLVMQEKSIKVIRKLLSKHTSSNLLKGRRTFDLDNGESVTLSHEARIAVGLNWGNMSNRDAILGVNDGSENDWTYNDVQKILATLDDNDWDLIQGIWDHIDSYWPEISALEKRVTGWSPKKIEAQPFTTPSGRVMRGGYYPLVGDARLSERAEKNSMIERGVEMMRGAWSGAHTSHGHTIERTYFAGQVVKLDLGVAFKHIDQVIHDLTHREALRQVDSVLRNKEVATQITDSVGKENYKQMRDLLLEIAAGPEELPDIISNMFRHIRTGMTLGTLGFSLRTMLVQPLALTQSIVRLGYANTAKGVMDFYLPFMNGDNSKIQFIYDRSPFMLRRSKTINREIYDQLKTVKGSSKFHKAKQAAFYMMIKGDQLGTMPTWMAAYNKGMKEFASDGLTAEQVEKKAIDYADEVVRNTFGSGLTKDLSGVLRGGELRRFLTTFYSFFNVYHNLLIEVHKRNDFKKPSDWAKYVSDMMLITVVPSLLSAALLDGIDDDDEWWEWALKTVGSYQFSSMVGVRDVGSMWFTDFGFGGTPYDRFGKDISRASSGLYDIATGEGDVKDLKAIVRSTSYLFHVPGTSQINRVIDAINESEDASEFIKIVATGHKD